MTARLVALAVVVAAALGLQLLLVKSRGGAEQAAGAAIALLPASLNGEAVATRWSNPQPGGVVEQGAVYGAAGGQKLPVQLDFYRNRDREHNGILCYVSQGEAILWHQFRDVATQGGTTRFEIAITDAGELLRLTAATECRKDGCTEREYSYRFGVPWTLLSTWRRFGGADDGEAVVPMSIVLQYPFPDNSRDRDAMQQELLRQFEAAAAATDLRPAQQLAAAMDGG